MSIPFIPSHDLIFMSLKYIISFSHRSIRRRKVKGFRKVIIMKIGCLSSFLPFADMSSSISCYHRNKRIKILLRKLRNKCLKIQKKKICLWSLSRKRWRKWQISIKSLWMEESNALSQKCNRYGRKWTRTSKI